MIEVKYTYDRDKRECSLLVKGHAGQADTGQDIVCASASILAYTVAQTIKIMDESGELADHPTLDLDKGDATIVCRAKDDDTFSAMMNYFYAITIGYQLLKHNYPQFVEIITDGETE